jgi:GAF domain-containing protein
METSKEMWFEAEANRLAGEVALISPEHDAAKAQSYFERSLAVARQQQAKSWELRASMSLARLWRDQGKVSEARELLAPVYGWFTEASKTAFSSAPIQDAEVARLTSELNEALERQAATSEVLEVISSSPGDLRPVFATMLEKAVRICDAEFGNIYGWEGETLRLIATHNTPPAFADARQRSLLDNTNRIVKSILASKTPLQVADAAAQPGYIDGSDLAAVQSVELGGVRTFLAVPMIKDNELIGSFTVYRKEVRPFTDKQIALITNFRRASGHCHRERAAAQRTAPTHHRPY